MSIVKTLLFVVLLGAVGAGAYYANNEIETKRVALEELTTKNTALTTELEALKKQVAEAELKQNQAKAQLDEIQEANCKGVWTAELGCQEPPPVFTYPIGEETLCFGTTVDVKWDANSVNAETVDILLATSSNSGKLATVTNSGGYTWKLEPTHKTIGGGADFTIAAGMYRLRMQSKQGKMLSKDTELFSVKKCNDKGAAPATAKALPKAKAKPATKTPAKPKRK